MLRSAASPGSVGFGRPGSDGSGLLKTSLPAGHLPPLQPVRFRRLAGKRRCGFGSLARRGLSATHARPTSSSHEERMMAGTGTGRTRSFVSGMAEMAAILALVAVSRTVVAQPFYVSSGSMQPTLQIGDELLAAKYAYGYSRYSLPFALGPASEDRLFGRTPQYGDVVLFHLPRNVAEVYVKRVIGLPGDRVQMRDGRLWINGR